MKERKKIFNDISRRGFLRSLFWAILGGTLTPSGLFFKATKVEAYPMPKGDLHMSTFNSNTFSGLVGEIFNVDGGQKGTLKAELIEVTDHTGARPKKNRNVCMECFSILFRIPSDQHLEQNTYNFFHKNIGTFALFIVPVGINENGRLYEAVFNRLKV